MFFVSTNQRAKAGTHSLQVGIDQAEKESTQFGGSIWGRVGFTLKPSELNKYTKVNISSQFHSTIFFLFVLNNINSSYKLVLNQIHALTVYQYYFNIQVCEKFYYAFKVSKAVSNIFACLIFLSYFH